MRNVNRPDRWVVLKLTNDDDVHYRVFATWFGGYTDGDRWKMNSGIKSVDIKQVTYKLPKITDEGIEKEEKTHEVLQFFGYSGSCYECEIGEGIYGTNSYTNGILNGLIEKVVESGGSIEVMPPDTNWLELFKNETPEEHE